MPAYSAYKVGLTLQFSSFLNIGPAEFRGHPFATLLSENGENLRNIQEQIGHNSSKATERYTHIVGINNKKLMNFPWI